MNYLCAFTLAGHVIDEGGGRDRLAGAGRSLDEGQWRG